MPKTGRVSALSTSVHGASHVRSRALAAAVSTALGCASGNVWAQQDAKVDEEVIVTATRRAESIQEVPFNIAAVNARELEEQGVTDLAELGRTVPGLYVVDQGPRSASQIVVRGLNANSITASEALGNSGGDVVQTYVGEIPLYVDLRLDDMERVEVLLGPQGTLYGAGTLGGAIRYIPTRPQFDRTTVQVRGQGYGLAHSDGIGSDVSFTANLPLAERFAVRASVGYLNDPGFVDYNYLVRQPGVSDPEPDFSDPADVAANLRRKEDADDEQTLYGRVALRAMPLDGLDIGVTYYYQDQEVGARTMDQVHAFGTPRYVASPRYEEPNNRTNQLLALEIAADLGFAELTSASGASRYRERGGRDQTDLLLTLEYSYEAFPSFSAFTRERQKDETFSQEFRLVSKTGGRFDWIAGAFYNRLKRNTLSLEYTPLYSEYLLTLDPSFGYRPDALEYVEIVDLDQEELAAFGELQFHISEQWQVTAGARWYDYEQESRNASTTPLYLTAFAGEPPDSVDIAYVLIEPKDNGTLFKLNTSYQFTDDLMAYATVSEGYRIGGSNGIRPCEIPLLSGPQLCALPDEAAYLPDETTNYEIGVRSEWLNKRLLVNASVYYIDWKDPQLASTTDNGALPITRNGRGAESQGLEVNFAAKLTEQFSVRGSYAYTQAELTEDAPSLLNMFVPPGFRHTRVDVDGLKGDRLPGSPEQQGSLWLNYEMPVGAQWQLDVSYGLTAQGDIVTKTGGRAGGETLGGFTVHHASVNLRADAWSVGLYAKNLFDKYAATGVRATQLSNQTIADENGEPVTVRSYYRDLLRPREIGLRFTYDFEL